MKNICKDGEELRFDLEANELYEEVKKYFTIVMLKKQLTFKLIYVIIKYNKNKGGKNGL